MTTNKAKRFLKFLNPFYLIGALMALIGVGLTSGFDAVAEWDYNRKYKK